MKIDEMNIVITGANGVLASYLLEYFSARAAFVVGTVRRLVEVYRPKNNEVGDIHVWLNIIGGFTMGNYVEKGYDDWIYV